MKLTTFFAAPYLMICTSCLFKNGF